MSLLFLIHQPKYKTHDPKKNTQSQSLNATFWEGQLSPAALQIHQAKYQEYKNTKHPIRNPKFNLLRRPMVSCCSSIHRPKYQIHNKKSSTRFQIQPFEKANGLLLLLNPFPSRPLLLISLHPTLPPSNLYRQIIFSFATNISSLTNKDLYMLLASELCPIFFHLVFFTPTSCVQWYWHTGLLLDLHG